MPFETHSSLNCASDIAIPQTIKYRLFLLITPKTKASKAEVSPIFEKVGRKGF